MRSTLAQSVQLIGGPQAYGAGATGLGQTVAILDTGVAKTHPFLSGKVVSEACFSTTDAAQGSTSLCPGGAPLSTASGSGVNCTGVSGCEHGTHVAGIAAGKGASFTGVAKDAKLIAVQVFSRFSTSSGTAVMSYTSDQIKGLQRVFALRSTFKISSVNMSLGGGRYSTPAKCDADNLALKTAIDNLRSAGIATVIASGNDGYTDSISAPGCISSTISVGSTTKSDAISSFSNGAPNLHLLAPGSSINSSVPGGGFLPFDGTSMATPHVAGAWALMKQKAPAASVSQVLAALQTTGKPINDTRPGAIVGVKRRIQVNSTLAKLSSECTNYEPNGNATTSARDFGVGTTELHSFCAASDSDWSKFAVTKGSAQYVIETSALASLTDTVLQLYRSTNTTTPIASSDDIVAGSNKASRIVVNLAPGTYLARAFQKGGAGSSTRTYSLRITRLKYLATACSVDEPNDTTAAAKPITLGATKSYAFCEAPDLDMVKFTGAANTRYLIEASPVAGSVDAAIDVYQQVSGGFNYLGTIDSGFAGGAEASTVTMGSAAATVYLVYYDFNSTYGPANTYGARVSVTTSFRAPEVGIGH